MEPPDVEMLVGDLELRVDRLRALYDQYFMGIEKLEPLVPRKDVDRKIAILRKEQIRNTALRFRFQMVLQRYNTYQTYWIRICRQIEDGTYKRHMMRAQARFGDRPSATPGIVVKEREGSVPPPLPSDPDDLFAGLEAADEVDTSELDFGMLEPLIVPATAPPDQRNSYPTTERDIRAAAPQPARNASPDSSRPVWRKAPPTIPSKGEPTNPAPPPVPTPAPVARPPAPPAPPRPAPIAAANRPTAPAIPRPAPPAAPTPRGPVLAKIPLEKMPSARPPAPSAARPTVPTPPLGFAPPNSPARAPEPPRPKPAASAPATPSGLPEERVRQLYAQFVDTKRKQNESTAAVTFDSLARSLRESSARLRQKHGKDVDFEVAVKDGKTIIRPVVK